MKHHIVLIIHLLAATIWVGGHLLLAFRYLPATIKHKDISILNDFRSKFGKIWNACFIYFGAYRNTIGL